MSDYQQQAGWEWRDQEEECWHAENISSDLQLSMSELAIAQPVIDQMLAQFDSVFGQSEESI
ncbi:hypothetical protein [Psychrobacter aquimaris]|uniref:hypothetical protein n=1 Tax=Psychrobacter aquimaris TaxID=292733 RepID=UPI0018DF65D9|nr:hypothetical protein [Psychrobacter aquimaris]